MWIWAILVNRMLIVRLAWGINLLRNKIWIWVLWPKDNVLNVLDGVTTPDNALLRTNKGKGARDSKIRIHNQKEVSRDLLLRDPILLEKVFKMAKWGLGDQKVDLKDPLFVLSVASLATRQ